MIKVLIADDHPLVREGLKKTLSAESDIRILGEAKNSTEVLDFLRHHHVDVVVLDDPHPATQLGWPLAGGDSGPGCGDLRLGHGHSSVRAVHGSQCPVRGSSWSADPARIFPLASRPAPVPGVRQR